MTDYQMNDQCWCLRKLQHKLSGEPYCTKHGKNHVYRPIEKMKEPKQKIPRYSGKSKTPYGGYEER